MSAYIEFQDVKKVYQMGEVSIEALAGVDFAIDKGEFVVIAGASGAGKSTILNILGGMDSFCMLVLLAACRDRKSTRLNSSH